FKKLRGKFKRINLHLMDIPTYEEKDIDLYKVQVEKIAEILVSEYKKGNAYECNFLSDRILLSSMKNCNAGIDHITVGPNGKYYLCPGFYSEDENNTIEFSEHDRIVHNVPMLSLEEAPICSICDCYQCKRCYYLNNKVTMQLNTPSYQQCVLSHHERNASRQILSTLHKIKEFKDLNHIPPIPEINYLDPFEVIIGQQKNTNSSPTVKNPETNLPKLNTKSIPEKTAPVKTMNENKSPGMNHSQQIPVIQSKKTLYPARKIMSLSEFKNLSVKEMLIELFKTQQELMKEFTIRDEK
ncbi:MAG: CXXX repeat peptide maturase, partial [Spirochaetales bacterium]|nr:CXXX repeat peptide maturase [Spirochaetales bacterium]